MLQKILKKITGIYKRMEGPEKRYSDLFENSIDGMYISTLDGQYIEVNNALVKILGYESKKDLLRMNTRDLYWSPEERPSFDERDRTFGTCLKKKDGTRIYAEISSRVLFEAGRPTCYQGIVRDRTEYKKYEEKIEYLSFHDALTDLYNWAYFNEELKRLRQSRVLPVTIIVADVNRLKHVNDTFGHETGDRLLKKAADIFRKNFRNDDIIARTGGDEFCMILPGASRKDALKIIHRINIRCTFESSERSPISIAFGAAEKSRSNISLRQVLKDAEKAMYVDKRRKCSHKGKNNDRYAFQKIDREKIISPF